MTTKQCGTCGFWDRENETKHSEIIYSCCLHPVPFWVQKDNMSYLTSDEGEDCPVYVKRQEVVEDDYDRIDENGYTRTDEDWFFDDKDK